MVKPNGYIQGTDGNPLELMDITARRQLAGKLDAPGSVKVGDYLRVQSIGADGTVVLEGAKGTGADSGQNPSQGGTGVTAELKAALKAYFTNVQTLIGQTAYSVPNPVADIVIGNARAVLDALDVQPEQPDSGIIQSGSILAITSGVTVTQTGSALTIR